MNDKVSPGVGSNPTVHRRQPGGAFWQVAWWQPFHVCAGRLAQPGSGSTYLRMVSECFQVRYRASPSRMLIAT